MLSLISSSEFLPDVIHDDFISIDITLEDRNNLPHQFLDVVKQLNQNYLHWKHLRDTKQATHATFYLYTKDGIKQSLKKAAESDNPIEQNVLLILETNLALATINSLLITCEEYLKAEQLQNCKDSIDTALSTLYEFIKTREKLSQSRDIAIESIRQDITNDNESTQYASYGARKISGLQHDARIDDPNLYVVRQQLTSLQETFTLICPEDIGQTSSNLAGKQRLNSLLSNIFIELVKPNAKITTNKASASDNFSTITNRSDVPVGFFSPNGGYYLRQVPGEESISATTAKIIEVETGEELRTITYKGWLTAMSFSTDGAYAEVFFKAWRIEQANASSFYEFMLAKAEQGGLSAKYNAPILETTLLLEALFCLVASAEKNYQTISPYLADLENGELYLPALQNLRDNVSAALSSLYEFIHSRMRLDDDSYPQALERFQRDIEVDVYTSQLILTIYEKILAFLRYDGIKQSSEFHTVKGMLDKIFDIIDVLLPDEVRHQRNGSPNGMANNISIAEALQVIEAFDLTEAELVPLLSKLKHSGVTTYRAGRLPEELYRRL